jgi:hypothetical protein
MSVVGVLTGGAGQADDGVAMDAEEASRGADAAALVEVLENGEGCLLGEMAAVERRALALGEAGATGVAIELAELFVLAVVATDREVAGVAPAVERTVGILATEAGEVVHGSQGLAVMGREAIRRRNRGSLHILRPIPHRGSTCLGHDPLAPVVAHGGTGCLPKKGMLVSQPPGPPRPWPNPRPSAPNPAAG